MSGGQRLLAAALTGPWTACTTGWATALTVTAPLTVIDRKVPVLRLLLTPLAMTLAAVEAAFDLFAGEPGTVVDGVGPWVDLDDVTAAL